MGNQFSAKVGYHELRDSIPGSLVADQDFELFYSLCKVDTVRTMSTFLHPSPSQLFFVVVAGEVNVLLTCPELRHQKAAVATTFRTGETIHFFNIGLRVSNGTGFDFGECLRNGDVKLALHFKSTQKAAAKVIGLDKRAFEIFSVKAKCNLHALHSFLSLSVVDITARSPFFKTIAPEQAAMLGPLLKVRLSHPGKIISPFTSEMASTAAQTSRLGSPKAKREVIPANYTPAGPIALLLSGTALSVPYGTNLNPIVQRLSTSTPTTSILKSPILPSLNRYNKPQPTNAPPPIHYPALSEQQAAQSPDADSDRNRTHLTMHPGILLGLSDYYCSTPRVILRSYIASSPSVIGYLDISTLDALFTVDPRFSRVLRRNYYMLIMAWLKPTVALLRDMDEWSFALLSCKVFIKSFLADQRIYHKGETSDYAYVVLGGSVTEVTETSSLKTKLNPSGGTATTSIERTLNWGTLFGEVALATNSPYFNTTTAREPTMLLAISKKVLDQIYNNNKAKLCEIRIRLMGMEVGLQHVIDHPRGSELFQAFLAKQHAAENLQFYVAVDRFDAMCRDVRKQYMQIMKLRDESLPGMHGCGGGIASSSASVGGASTADDNTTMSYGTYHSPQPNIHDIARADQQLTSREESEVNVTAPMEGTTGTSRSGATGASASEKHLVSTTATDVVNSRTSSFALEESHKSAATDSSKSMFNYYHAQANTSFGIASHPGSMDVGLLTEGEDQSTRSSIQGSNKSSQKSHRSFDSSVSDIFINAAMDPADGSEGGVSELHSRNLALHAHVHSPNGTHAMWGKPTMKKPALESIISESNFAHVEDDDGELDGQKKFSIKHKPQSVSAYSGLSNKIALIVEENENEGEDEGSPIHHTPALVDGISSPASGAVNNAGALSSSAPPASVFSAENLKRAIMTAVSIAEASPDKYAPQGVKATSTIEEVSGVDVAFSNEYSTGSIDCTVHAAHHSLYSAPPSSDKTHIGASITLSPPGQGVSTPTAHYTATTAAASSVEPSPLAGTAAAGIAGIAGQAARSSSSHQSIPKDPNGSAKGGTSRLYIGDRTTGSTATGANAPPNNAPLMDRKAADTAQKINRQLHRVQKNIVELKEVARTIMSTYIYNNTEHQLNLPGAMRVRTEENFEAWSTQIIANAERGEAMGLSRQDSFDLTGSAEPEPQEPQEYMQPSPMPKMISMATHMSSVSSVSYGESSSRSMSLKVTKLAHLGESSRAFKQSEPFISTFKNSEQDGSGSSARVKTPSPTPFSAPTGAANPVNAADPANTNAAGTVATDANSTNSSAKFIPAPIRIPDFAGNLAPISSSSTTPGATAQLRSISVDPQSVCIEHIDMAFVDLFKETKNEILKLLRDDKFPRWKATAEFQAFIASVKPYEKEGNSGTSGGDGREYNRDRSSSKDSRSLEVSLNIG